ncbi:class I SAM-dependent methyltransferase [Candidatus Pelagibacter sp. HIMB1495]|uniref:class I SAM-dependent methyltransferase n=1 Tax=unclassified Candidatus Pelagibacter TaxID=2647897 RepID=UPI003F864FE7
MNKWNNFFLKNDGNNFPHQSLIIFFNRNFSNLKKKINILDLGCGTGSTLILLRKKNFFIDCVDISKEALKKLKQKHLNKNVKTFNLGFNDFLKNSKKKYDLIIDGASLQHQTEDDLKISYSLINKNLKKQGYFFSINLNSSKGLNDESFNVTKLKKKKLLYFFKLCNLKNIDYNYYYYTENNSKDFIKFNIITGQK